MVFSFAAAAQAAHTEATLLLDSAAARPGDTVMAGIRLRMESHWHTYWKNPGASGIATTVKWELPAGITAGGIQWPIPKRLPPDDLLTYIYEDEAVLLVPLKISSDVKAGSYPLKAEASWLECKEQCIPGSAELTATLEVGANANRSADATVIDAWKRKLAQPGGELSARATWEAPSKEDLRGLILEWASPTAAGEADFYPFASNDFEVQGATEPMPAEKGKVKIRKQVKKFQGDWPKEISGWLIEGSGQDKVAHEVTLSVTTAARGTTSGASVSWPELLGCLGLAFVGGLILNVMPCVLPVIALKILSFIKQSGEEPRRARRLSLVYGLGVLVSFLVLAGFLIAAQQAGGTASWGMQMQNRNFVIGMTIMVTLISLNLFGLFEVTLGSGTMNAANTLASKSGVSGAFFNGVVATVLAIPCTAPVLAGAVTFALAQPPLIILLAFSFIALGLAFPYILLTWNPQLLKLLPRPGPWMQRFKVALGFPMLATVVWLYKLSVNHLTKSQSLWLGIFLVTLAAGLWTWGEFVQRGRTRRGLAAVISLILVGSVGAYASTRKEGIIWQPWSMAAVEQARSAGRPVLVDFTADWCVTCQVNLRFSIDVPKVREKLAEVKAVTLVADYTLKSEDIGRELHRFGRDAVPLVVVFPKTPGGEPIILPPALTPQIVLDALDRAK